MIERRMRDFRLDTRLRKACEHDILTTCAYVGDPEAIDSAYDNSVADCLQVGPRRVEDGCNGYTLHTLTPACCWFASSTAAVPCPHAKQCRCAPPGSCGPGHIHMPQGQHSRCPSCHPPPPPCFCPAQDYKDEIHSDECKAQVQHYLQLASQDIRFDVPLAEACGDDRRILCANVPPVSWGRRAAAGTCTVLQVAVV